MRIRLSLLGLLVVTSLSGADAGWSDPAAHTVRMIDHGGVKLELLDFGGAGEVVVCLAGLGSSGHIYDHFAAGLRDHHRVLALTRRGLGGSDKPASGYDLDSLVEDIRQCLDALEIKRAVLLGHSFGAVEAAGFARAHPDRVAKVIYLDGAYTPSPERQALFREAGPLMPGPTEAEASAPDGVHHWLQANWPGWNEGSEADFHAMQSPRPPAVFRALWETASTTQPGFEQVAAPSLALFADDRYEFLASRHTGPDGETARRILDRLGAFHHAAAEWYRTQVRGTRVVELRDTNHDCFIQRETEVLKLVNEFADGK